MCPKHNNNISIVMKSPFNFGLHCELALSVWLISHGTIFFSHNKTTRADLSATETIQQTGWEYDMTYYSY
jgi:hypothetical protein